MLKGHDVWARLAVAPDGINFAREEGRLPVAEFQNVIRRSDLTRNVSDESRLATMLAHANLLITARDASGQLIGVARSLTDFAFCCYLSDLYVDQAYQGRGIGRALIAETKRIVGPESMVLLLATPKSISYYPSIGMDKVANGYIIRRDC